MTSFLMVAVLLSALALAFIITPLVSLRYARNESNQRGQLNLAVLRDQLRELELDLKQGIIDQAAYASARHELEIRVAQDVGTDNRGGSASAASLKLALLLSLAVLVLTGGLYQYLGNKDGLDPAKQAAPAQAGNVSPGQINAMLAQLVEHLKQEPNDAKGWAILARGYAGLGRFAEANQAYAKLLALQPASAEALTDAADAMAMSQGQSLQGEPEKLLQRALALEPKNVKALILLGTAKYDRKDFAGAVVLWQQMRELLPPDSPLLEAADANIRQAQILAAGGNPNAASGVAAGNTTGSAVASATASAASSAAATSVTANPGKAGNQSASNQTAASAAIISGSVDIDPAARSQLAPTDTVFIFARAPEGGPRFPLAVLRKQVKDLPLQFTLDDTLAMMPDAKLSGFKQVQVGARISKTGNAIAASGDWEGSAGLVALGAEVTIVINKQRP